MFRLLVTVLFLLFVYHVREVFPPFIMGAITAYILYPAVKWLQRWGFAPIFSVFVIYVCAASFTVFIMFHFWPMIVDQAESIFSNRKEIVVNLMQQVSSQFNWSIDVNQMADLLIAQLQNAVGKPEDIVHFGGLISKSLLGMLVCAVTSVYLLVDSKRVGRFFMRFIPVEKRNTVVSLLTQMDKMFRKYIYGQVGLISLMSVVAFCIFSAFHLKYALLIALITGFLEIIPVLGPMLAIIICSVFAVAQLGIAHAMGVPLCLWIARLIEDYVIVPNTIGHAVELHPLAVIFAVIVGETMAGALGMLIAIPVAASVKVIIDFCYPPTTPPAQHEPKRKPVEWLSAFFNPPKRSSDETDADRAKADMDTINQMHESSSLHHSPLPHAQHVTTSEGEAATAQPVQKKTPVVEPDTTQPPAVVAKSGTAANVKAVPAPAEKPSAADSQAATEKPSATEKAEIKPAADKPAAAEKSATKEKPAAVVSEKQLENTTAEVTPAQPAAKPLPKPKLEESEKQKATDKSKKPDEKNGQDAQK